jgi:hypothetical protein
VGVSAQIQGTGESEDEFMVFHRKLQRGDQVFPVEGGLEFVGVADSGLHEVGLGADDAGGEAEAEPASRASRIGKRRI